MKTLKKQAINTSGKTETIWLRVKDNEVKDRLADGFKLCGKVEWKTATKGYGKGKEKKTEVRKDDNITEGIVKKHYQKPRRS